MTKHFERLAPAEIKDMQLKSAKSRKHNQAQKDRIASLLYEDMGSVEAVIKYFGLGRTTAYKMIERGNELRKNES